jgi:hypothetical protein
VGIRKLRKRPVMMVVTREGIMIRANADGVCISMSLLRDLFIPWERIECLFYLSSKQVQAEGLWLASGGWGKADPVIVIRIRRDAVWPPSGTLRHDVTTQNARPGEVYVNGQEGSPGGAQLWERLRTIARQHGVSLR